MALKDWKKQNGLKWANDKLILSISEVYSNTEGEIFRIQKTEIGKSNLDDKDSLDSFKTKKEALAYARRYMRKH